MTAKSLKALSQIRDLEIVDSEGELCGVCDDIEFEGAPGKPLRIMALLVGPGAYRGRVWAWVRPLVKLLGGDGMVRVPWTAVEHVTSRITVNVTAQSLGLGAVERRLRPLVLKVPMAR